MRDDDSRGHAGPLRWMVSRCRHSNGSIAGNTETKDQERYSLAASHQSDFTCRGQRGVMARLELWRPLPGSGICDGLLFGARHCAAHDGDAHLSRPERSARGSTLFSESLALESGRRPCAIPAVCGRDYCHAGAHLFCPPLFRMASALDSGSFLCPEHCLGRRAYLFSRLVAAQLLQRALWTPTAACDMCFCGARLSVSCQPHTAGGASTPLRAKPAHNGGPGGCATRACHCIRLSKLSLRMADNTHLPARSAGERK